MALEALSFENHSHLRVTMRSDIGDADHAHLIPITLSEIQSSSVNFPLLYVKNSETGQLQFVAMTGFEAGKNLFVTDDGWGDISRPLILSFAPFRLITDPNNPDLMHVGLDVASSQVSETEGEALFNEDGGESEYLSELKKRMANYYEQSLQTNLFIKELLKLDLLSENSLKINSKGKERNLSAIYLVDKNKLNSLPDEKFLDLRKRGLLEIIFAQITSLSNLGKLVARDE